MNWRTEDRIYEQFINGKSLAQLWVNCSERKTTALDIERAIRNAIRRRERKTTACRYSATYKGLRPPKCGCAKCAQIYEERKAAKRG